MDVKTDKDSLDGARNDAHVAQEEPLNDPERDFVQMEDKLQRETSAFDTGLQAWLQVLGAFFLWFNTWYVRNIQPYSLTAPMIDL
jgi:hypothetical protein